MGACKGCGQIILVLVNLLFSLIGILLLVVGFIVKYGRSVMDDILNDWYTRFDQALKDAGVINTNFENFNIEEFLSDTAIVFIVVGAFFFILGIVGCIGACCQVRWLLITYSIIIILLVLVEVTFVILLFAIRDQIDEWLKRPLIDAVENHYTGTNGTDAVTLGLNFVMSEFDCCGVNNYSEFENSATKWQRIVPDQVVPLICCKNTTQNGSAECLTQPTTENAYIAKGCYSAIFDWVSDHEDILIGTGAGVAAVEILLIIFACVVCWKKRRGKEGYEEYD